MRNERDTTKGSECKGKQGKGRGWHVKTGEESQEEMEGQEESMGKADNIWEENYAWKGNKETLQLQKKKIDGDGQNKRVKEMYQLVQHQRTKK